MMDKILVLNVAREGYAPDQVRDTMTVGELMVLEKATGKMNHAVDWLVDVRRA